MRCGTPLETRRWGKSIRRSGRRNRDNVGVESAHKSEEAAETGVRLVREGYRSHKLKPYPQGGSGREKAGKGQCKCPISEVFAGKSPACQQSLLPLGSRNRPLKKEYAAAKRAGQAAGSTAKTASKDRQGGKNRQGKGTAGGCVCHAPQERGWHRPGPLFGGLPPDEYHFLLLYAGTGYRLCGDGQHPTPPMTRNWWRWRPTMPPKKRICRLRSTTLKTATQGMMSTAMIWI